MVAGFLTCTLDIIYLYIPQPYKKIFRGNDFFKIRDNLKQFNFIL